MAFGFIKKLVEKITGKKPAAQKKDGRSQQKQGGDDGTEQFHIGRILSQGNKKNLSYETDAAFTEG